MKTKSSLKASKPQSNKVSKETKPRNCRNVKDVASVLPDFMKKGAGAVAGIYLCTTTLGCAPCYVNGAKVYDPDQKKNPKVYAAADNIKTDANTGEKVAWYKTKLGIIGITATAIIIGTVAGFAIYNHNKKDADAPAGTTPTPGPGPEPL